MGLTFHKAWVQLCGSLGLLVILLISEKTSQLSLVSFNYKVT